MKKFFDDVDTLLEQSLQGFALAHADLVQLHRNPTYITRRVPKAAGRVALISGGGSGHEPLHIGYVGAGMLDAACPGQVFTSPTPDQMLAAAKAVDRGQGVLFIVKNYAGDTMNFQMASEMLSIEHTTVLVNDDVAVENSTHTTGRRGVAGTVVVEKIVGAAAESGADLAQCKRLGDRANARTASMGVAFSSCTVPAAGVPTFEIGAGEIEMGVGIHGEPGRRRELIKPASAIVDELLDAVLADLQPAAGQPMLMLVNGLGATPLMELYLLQQLAAQRLEREGLKLLRTRVGNMVTSLEMAGASLTLTMLDDELLQLWDAPARTAALSW
ncbi:MAG: dihydroxyacetone kinase subunit DhaK [Rubrivivax sp.]|nr:dihydroxyacetone kinase subunit DhaK [Rubrivivax sp.]